MTESTSFTVEEIASWFGGTVEGNASQAITGLSDLESAQSDQVSFLGNSKYVKAASASEAGVIIVDDDYQPLQEKPQNLIRTEKPSAAFAIVIEKFIPARAKPEPGISPQADVAKSATIDPTASIGPHVTIEAGATIGARTRIDAGCVIGKDVTVGEECHLYPRVSVLERCLLGNRVILYAGCVIGSDGFGYEFENGRHQKILQVGIVQLDDDVEVGANTTIDRGRFDRTWIKEGTKIDNLVQIAHNVTMGPHAIIVAQNGIAGSTKLGAYVVMGGQSATVGHVEVADQVSITAWTAVTKDITKPGVYRGGPAKPMRESMKIEALTHRLPELYERLKKLEAASE
ncbi:MAG: UDP-3-O-(3-hydroxymyristoyl)glucosamine N-acyltransferase [Verrucomicrobiota bacterium]